MDKEKYINALVGSLDTPNKTFLIECLPLETVALLIAVFFYTLWMTWAVADLENFGGGGGILSTKPQKFGCLHRY